MRWSTGAFAALGGITAAVATGGTALRSPAVVDRLNDWAARRLTVQQRADPYAAILPTPISGDDFTVTRVIWVCWHPGRWSARTGSRRACRCAGRQCSESWCAPPTPPATRCP